MKPIYEEVIDGKHIKLTEDGDFYIDGVKSDWYKDIKTSKPWIVKKRSSFIGLVKQILRD